MAKVKRYISADYLEDLFHAPTRRRRRLPSWQIVSAVFLIFVAVFLFVNWPAMSAQIAYWWRTDIQASKQLTPVSPVTVTSPLSATGATPSPAKSSKNQTINPQEITNNTIYIPKTNTKAPVIWDVSGGQDLNTDLLTALQRGVVRYPKTALPNQIGNVFLTGHSSNYWWDKGQYKTIFALLDKLVAGDIIYIKYQNVLYTYKVSGQKIVSPNETSVLNPTKTPVLSLMTCTPTGTALRRRIVTAQLVSPSTGLVEQPTRPDLKVINAVR